MRNAILLSFLLFWGCGGAQSTAVEVGTEEAPAISQTSVEPSAKEESAAEEPSAGPASIVFASEVAGAQVSGRVKLFNQAGELAAEGDCGQSLTVQSGSYSVEVQVTDDQALADKPSKRLEIELQPGAQSRQEVAFPWSRVRVVVRIKGVPARKAEVTLFRKGKEVATLQSGAEQHLQISPGHYEVEVKSGGMLTRLDDVMFPEGATRDIPIDVTF